MGGEDGGRKRRGSITEHPVLLAHPDLSETAAHR